MSIYSWIKAEVPKGLEVRQVYGFIFSPDGRILLLEDEGQYNLPGGRPENGETYSETLIREATEEVQATIACIEYLGYQLIAAEEEYAQVRLIAFVDQLQRAAPDPSTGRKYSRLWVPPTELNELLQWGGSGNEQIASAIAAASNLGVVWNVSPRGYI